MEAEIEITKGSYILYQKGNQFELGRVIEDLGEKLRVCYSSGCTASITHKDDVILIINQDEIVSTTLGYNRFNSFCPDYNEECCSSMCPDKHSLLFKVGDKAIVKSTDDVVDVVGIDFANQCYLVEFEDGTRYIEMEELRELRGQEVLL